MEKRRNALGVHFVRSRMIHFVSRAPDGLDHADVLFLVVANRGGRQSTPGFDFDRRIVVSFDAFSFRPAETLWRPRGPG